MREVMKERGSKTKRGSGWLAEGVAGHQRITPVICSVIKIHL